MDGDKTIIKPTVDLFVSGVISARMMPHTPGALQDTKNPQPKEGREARRVAGYCLPSEPVTVELRDSRT